jgi:hypothetical protein
MKSLAWIATAGLVVGLGAPATAIARCVAASGPARSETRATGVFDKLEVKGPVDVHLSRSNTHTVRIEAPAAVLPVLVTEVVDGTLVVRTTTCIEGDDDDVRVHVAAPAFQRIRLRGSGDLHADDTLKGKSLQLQLEGSGDAKLRVDVERLEVSVTGSGDATLVGRASAQEIRLSGSGEVDADELEVNRARVRLDGSGDVELRVSGELDAEVRGSGTVTYAGKPGKVRRQVLGSGDIRAAR